MGRVSIFRKQLPVVIMILVVCCSQTPTEPSVDLIIVDGLTARANGIETTLRKFNLSWYPADDSPFPPEDTALVTVFMDIANHSDHSTMISRHHFLLRTLSEEPHTGPTELHTGPTWQAIALGRSPTLKDTVLLAGESITGWLTFSVPKPLLAEEVLWFPEDRTAYALEVRWFSPARVEEAKIFGKLEDIDGSPLAGIPLRITPVETEPSIPGSETTVGDCRGVAYPSQETITNGSGSYALTVASRTADELCIDVQVVDQPSVRGAGVVRPGRPSEMAETPLVRVDLTLN